LPIREWLGAAIHHLHWTPRTFWAATPHEFFAAQEAIERANAARENAQGGGGSRK
jgi:hypothetical protein